MIKLMNISLNEIKEKLHEILNEKPGKGRGELVTKFDDMIFLCDDLKVDEDIEDVLVELAWDLEYYVSDPQWREEDPSYYGDERLEQEINEALQKIEVLRNKIQ